MATESAARPRTNWAGNIVFTAPDFHRPASLSQLQALVARSARVRVLATGHSFNDMADSPGAQVSLAAMPADIEVDSAASLVKVPAALTYAQLAGRLDARGLALRNLASLPHISVAGACATATHGSGLANQNLAAAVAGLTLVTAGGDVLELSRQDDCFGGAVVHLGALGVVVSLTLDVVPSFGVSQRVYEDLPLDVLDDHFAAVMAAGYSVSLFTDWRASRLTQIWIKQRLPASAAITTADSADPATTPADSADPAIIPADPAIIPADPAIIPADPAIIPADPAIIPADPAITPADPATTPADPATTATVAPNIPSVTQESWFTATPAPAPRNPVPGMSPDACTQQLGVPGPWYARLPHFRPDFQPSVGDELQSEYLLPVSRAVPALHALNQIRDRLAPVLRICEIRAVAADQLWLSPCYQQDSVAFHFTWIPDTAAVLPVVTLLERQLAPFAPRSHWGKVFTTSPETLRSAYLRLPAFVALARRLDPTAKFRNPYTDRYLPT